MTELPNSPEASAVEVQNDELQPAPIPKENLVRVFDTEQESEAIIVQGLLESAGIDAEVTGLDAPQDILPGVGGNVVVVRETDAAEARQVIDEVKQTPDDGAVA